jgi:flagellar biosynthetic protein FlhB
VSIFGEERNHLPTAARLKRARQEGDVTHSSELATSIQMISGVITLWFCVSAIGNGLRTTTQELWANSGISIETEAIVPQAQSLVWTTTRLVLPFLITVFVIGTMANLVQTRFLIRAPRLSISPITGQQYLKNLFSFSTFGQIILSTPKVALALIAGAAVVWTQQETFFALGGMPTNLFASALRQQVALVSACVAGTLLICSLFDYAVKWFSMRRRLRMTDQEMRDELRGQSGDPQIARVRHLQMRSLSGRSEMED